ncbi:MAG: hypothetical protein BWY63_00463 [Chloroflexi bacterium ADurb.Bin360]|nr:MAG: hypothetical protein BWY63_00463 [Chloroflexi bacterium ADurb.Bin360]
MDWNANRAALVSDGAGYCLTNPPGGIRREFVPTSVIEFVGGANKADIAFLNQVKERHAASDVFLCHTDYQTGIGANQVLSRSHSVLHDLFQFFTFGIRFGARQLGLRFAPRFHAHRQRHLFIGG